MATFGKFWTSKAILFVHTLRHKCVGCSLTRSLQLSNALSCSHMPFVTTVKWEGEQRGLGCIREGGGRWAGGGGTTKFQYKTNTTWVSEWSCKMAQSCITYLSYEEKKKKAVFINVLDVYINFTANSTVAVAWVAPRISLLRTTASTV